MRLTPKMQKALAWYVGQNDLLFDGLGNHPTYFFKDRRGNKSNRNITNLVSAYEQHLKDSKRKQGA